MPLSIQQKKAANLLVNRDINKLTVKEIAQECEISYSQLLAWRQQDEFISYMDALSEKIMQEFLSESYSELRKLMRSSNDNLKLKTIELVLKNRGKLRDQSDVKVEVMQKTNKELEEEIDILLDRTKL